MPTLAELKNKWFLNFAGTNPLGGRHEGTNVVVSTDNNTVTILDEGDQYMREWHDLIVSPVGVNQHIFHAGWKIDNIRTLGPGTGPTSSEALRLLETIHTGSSFVSMMMSWHVGNENKSPIARLGATGLLSTALDDRYPAAGSNHQKYLIKKDGGTAKALLGSVDVNIDRWGNAGHTLSTGVTSLTHDLGLKIEGPCVADIEHTYLERWNDTASGNSRDRGLKSLLPRSLPLLPAERVTPPLITAAVGAYPGGGSISIQTLHTYGRADPRGSRYSWAGIGEFTIWRSYLNAIQSADQYIYIEDQYFLPFDWPVCHSRPVGLARDTDLIYQLGEAIRRGVKVAVLLPDSDEDYGAQYIRHQRQIGLHYLATIAASTGGDFFAAFIYNGVNNIYVHSKVMLVDDEFALIGSANFNQRGMAHDGEIQLGLIDSNNLFVKNLRKKLYAEHTGRSMATFDDPVTAYNTYKADTAASHHRLRPAPTIAPGPEPTGHSRAIKTVVDPYAGPPGIR